MDPIRKADALDRIRDLEEGIAELRGVGAFMEKDLQKLRELIQDL